MRFEALPLAVLLLLAGCSGFIGGAPTANPTADDGPVRYGVAVQSDYADERTFGVRVRDDETTLLNRSKRLGGGGEQWHVANLSAENYGEQEYELQLLVDGEVRGTSAFSFRESENVERRSGATLLVQGPSSGASHNCAGNVTCYRTVVDG